MANLTASTVGLYLAGGSGDNLGPNNTVKGIEKVWMDTFTYSAVVTTADTILIGYVPAGAKIVGVDVVLPTNFAPTTATVNVGMSYSTALLISSSTAYVGASNNKCTINNVAGQNFATTFSTTTVSGGTIQQNLVQGVYLSLGVTAMTTPTAGTIQTIIRYL